MKLLVSFCSRMNNQHTESVLQTWIDFFLKICLPSTFLLKCFYIWYKVFFTGYHVFVYNQIYEQNVSCLPGQSQSPVGVLAMTSTCPYLKENELIVLSRALLIGFTMLFGVASCRQWFGSTSVHSSNWIIPFSSFSWPISLIVRFGLMCNLPLLTKLLSSLVTYHWNSPFYVLKQSQICHLKDHSIMK